MKLYNRSKWKIIARQIAVESVRNTFLEDLHVGTFPSSKTGDYSDVKVISPYGEIEWNKLSRISDEEMRKLMLEIEESLRLSLWFWNMKHKKQELVRLVETALFGSYGISWDNPKYHERV